MIKASTEEQVKTGASTSGRRVPGATRRQVVYIYETSGFAAAMSPPLPQATHGKLFLCKLHSCGPIMAVASMWQFGTANENYYF